MNLKIKSIFLMEAGPRTTTYAGQARKMNPHSLYRAGQMQGKPNAWWASSHYHPYLI